MAKSSTMNVVATAQCDENGCTESATYEIPLTPSFNYYEAVGEARGHFKALGWRFGNGIGFVFCPCHAGGSTVKAEPDDR